MNIQFHTQTILRPSSPRNATQEKGSANTITKVIKGIQDILSAKETIDRVSIEFIQIHSKKIQSIAGQKNGSQQNIKQNQRVETRKDNQGD